MYGVPEKERLIGLIGKELLQICFGVHQVIFNFDQNVQITIESRIERSVPRRGASNRDECCSRESFLTKLLGSTVSDVDRIDDKTLRLTFSSGKSIELTDDSDRYESFQIKVGGELIVV